LRERFMPLAERRGCAVICPLFPTGLDDPNDTNNYKLIKYGDFRYDDILLRIVDEVQMRYPRVNTGSFLLWGFSGGGQFVHRFAYLHPERLLGVAIGAPGTITLLDHESDFPHGISNFSAVFGVTVNLDALRRVPTLFLAGDADTGRFHAVARGRTVPTGYRGRYGDTIQLEASWSAAGMQCHFVAVPGAAHEEEKMLPFVTAFFEKILAEASKDHAVL
jgi:pimeloyl-ACP methyl ester carboxylesterase